MYARARLAILVAAALALVPAGCARDDRTAVVDAHHDLAGRIAEGHALVQQQQYDRAIDTFVQLAAEDGVEDKAIDGAGEALTRKVATQRVPQRITTAIELGKRLPAAGGRARLSASLDTMLVEPVLEQTRQGMQLLKNRRAFIQRMREEGEGDVLPAPRDRRVLTEAEVVAARRRLPELGAPEAIERLYEFARPLAAAMDRFIADDERYLGEEDVSDEQLDELEQSCDALGDALWPVQRQLDRLRPGWRR